MNSRDELARARRAVTDAIAATSPLDPLAASMLLAREELGEAIDPAPLIAHWATRSPGSLGTEMRYRWELSHRRGSPLPAYAGTSDSWRALRPREQPQLERDPFKFEEQLILPLVLFDSLELLARGADAGDATAQKLLLEAVPAMRRDVAQFIQALQPFRDLLALGYLTRRPRALAALHPLAVALATCYAAAAQEKGYVEGIFYPFANRPLVGPSAQLATGLWFLGLELERVASLIAFVRTRQLADGAFSDDGEAPDPLATLHCAELLSSVDPTFDPSTAQASLRGQMAAGGLLRVLGPEAPWLTAHALAWMERAERPFAERFRFPFLPDHNRDQKTRLPFFAYFADLGALFATLPGLASAPVELVFIDLAGFRAFNNAYGQDRGDDVLRVFGRALTALPFVRAIRDGGDEFLLVGAPGLTDLADQVERFRASWPRTFREAFGTDVPPVAPRVLVAHTTGRDLLAAREVLGRTITSLKHDVIPGPEGIQRHLGQL